jgi:hypothetical protein
MENPSLRAGISLTELTATFVPAGLLIAASLLAAEFTLSLDRYRALYPLWAAAALAIPAVYAHVAADGVRSMQRYWLLFWTFSFAAFLIHLGYSFKGYHRGSWLEVALAAVWAVDLALGWFSDSQARWVAFLRAGVLLGVLAWFTYALVSHSGEWLPLLLGFALVGAAVLGLWPRG